MGTEKTLSATVLVVDDDKDLLQLVDLKLQAEGFHTLLSLNGENIREIITRSRPDLVLLDIHMNGVNGGDICRDIKSNPATSSIPVLLFSANENIEQIKEECGADGFIKKPFQDPHFKDAIEEFLGA